MTAQVYLDTSALVKRYVAEAGSDDVAALLKTATYQIASIITEAELPAALGRAMRSGLIEEREGLVAINNGTTCWSTCFTADGSVLFLANREIDKPKYLVPMKD